MDCSTPGLPVHYQLPEFIQTHVHWVSDAIQPSHPLSSPSPHAFNLSQHEGLFQWVSSSHQVAKVLKCHPNYWETRFKILTSWIKFSSAQFGHSVVSDSLWPHELQHTRLSSASPIPGVYSNSSPLSRWCHLTISSSVVPFSSCLQSFPASRSFQMSRLFASGG